MESAVREQVRFEDILAAARRLNGVAHRTPVIRSRLVDEACSARVFFKAENLQRTGSFKFRGAYNALASLPSEKRAGGVLSYSSGNHAQALALAGRLLDAPVTIVMPDDAPAVKKAATAAYGAQIVEYNREETTREEVAQRLARDTGRPVIPPYDHPDVVAGQGTAARELFEEVGELDALLVCCGGGGLLSGSALSARSLSEDCTVVGVEPEAADDATRSFRTGILQRVHNPDTIADGARTPSLGAVTFPIVLAHVDDMQTVTEQAIREAMQFLMQRTKLVVEPTGALAFAALHSGVVRRPGQRIGVIISGGNVDLTRLPELLDGRE